METANSNCPILPETAAQTETISMDVCVLRKQISYMTLVSVQVTVDSEHVYCQPMST